MFGNITSIPGNTHSIWAVDKGKTITLHVVTIKYIIIQHCMSADLSLKILHNNLKQFRRRWTIVGFSFATISFAVWEADLIKLHELVENAASG